MFGVFKQFKSQAEKQYNAVFKTLRCDGGGKYKPIIQFAKENGIEIQIACPYTSSQNGRVERKHRHIVETGLALLAQAKMTLHHWWDAFFYCGILD